MALALLALPLLAAGVIAQFPPSPQDVRVVESRHEEGVSISYKEPGLCETTPGVKSYAGYVHFPPSSTEQYSTNTFFWFFESRNDPRHAPLAIWMNGGPGSSSMIGLLQENGPCMVTADSNGTELNPWSWNNYVNMLYIDQPNQVGFSYDELTNATYDQLTGKWDVADTPWKDADEIPVQNNTFYVGTVSSQNASATVNSTQNAAKALWHFAQIWLTEFPEYKPADERVSIWTESYGGRYGPSFTAYFQEQNERIADGSLTDGHSIHIDTLGIINGCVDLRTQVASYPAFAYNNTYGIEAINRTVYETAMDAFRRPGGCRDRIDDCHALAAVGDPLMTGANETVNAVCRDAENFCSNAVEGPYVEFAGRGYYDIAHVEQDPFPPPYFTGFLNADWVQNALGVPVNFTESSDAVYNGFTSVGDYPRSDVHGYLDDLAYLLDSGIKVALVYGDRDYACNWVGGEEASLAVNYSQAATFQSAGYTDLKTNASYIGGQVRQAGNFSFVRVYEAGHEVPAYQPQTAYEIFHRALFNRDLATGRTNTATDESYVTHGPSNTWHIKNEVPDSPEPTCYVRSLLATCTEEQIAAVVNGSAVKDYILVE
ncbi:hypothetical protein ASPZODRAFT_90893 [Penicilliopsis zonata CBS 506.65]|uniref:Carboxypeptidase n=1 Tax=Penicilliopsis zonata CBS 506.65 TaxID=1073090 RepID=A0A1L9SNX3_9EURO|nr:hypothetical protein ASPZODRAFT_90893 [Penicilliopsis zonata CBS 506.65]OJJ48898.1 hypothetical protein ASPZODRAFT_90893 [Penicilliopsis zonata CBS 506.65]